MKIGSYLLVLTTVVTVGLSGNIEFPPQPPDSNSTSTASPTTSSSTTPSSTTSSSTTSSTTPLPTTTSSTTPASTTSSSTTPASTTSSSTTPASTTSSSTTPASTTSSTTPQSTTSSTTTPTPPQPIPKPVDPTPGTWAVNNTASNNSACILVHAALQVKIPYIISNGNTSEAYVNVRPDATATGSCADTKQLIILTWNETNTLSLGFEKNGTSNKYYIKKIVVNVTPDPENFPNSKDNKTAIKLEHTRSEFETTVDKSYKCLKKQYLNLTTESVQDGIAILTISDFQFEGFHNTTNHQFTNVEDCAPFDTPDIVPIVVGCALAALVIVVLVAYLIGRRRRQARGYLSM